MSNDFNISPDMINNIVNMLKNSSSNIQEDFSDTNSNPAHNSDTNQSSNPDSSYASFDLQTFLKLKTIIDSFNSNDNPSYNLIHSLRPYLRKSKQAKLDQYANILKIAKISDFFKNNNGDIKP